MAWLTVKQWVKAHGNEIEEFQGWRVILRGDVFVAEKGGMYIHGSDIMDLCDQIIKHKKQIQKTMEV
jgi:hypothetical protein